MLQGKTVVVGVTGGIAAYKAANIVSALVKAHADVHVIMTPEATQFIAPLVMEILSGHPCYTECHDERLSGRSVHIALSEQADAFLVAPATANCISKFACGIADDVVSTAMLAMRCPVLIAPAMNTYMYRNEATQHSMELLVSRGYTIIPPATGLLACGEIGEGKFPSESVVLEYLYREIACEHDLAGRSIVVTAGPTQENIDPVRYITNHSTGRMGYALARRAMLRGAQVTLISGPVSLEPPLFVDVVPVVTAQDMFDAVSHYAQHADAVIKAAAVADFRPATVADEKIKKTAQEASKAAISLEKTTDILKYLGEHRIPGQRLCGFSMETCNVIENSTNKLFRKNVDMIAANSLREDGAGFGSATNHLTLIMRDKTVDVPMMSKDEAADVLLTELFNAKPLDI